MAYFNLQYRRTIMDQGDNYWNMEEEGYDDIQEFYLFPEELENIT